MFAMKTRYTSHCVRNFYFTIRQERKQATIIGKAFPVSRSMQQLIVAHLLRLIATEERHDACQPTTNRVGFSPPHSL